MATLTRASQELFRRSKDERFSSLDALYAYTRSQKEQSKDSWVPPNELIPKGDDRLALQVNGFGMHTLNHWSFQQLCTLAGVAKETVNKVSAETAALVLRETLPQQGKPFQVLSTDRSVRAIHGPAYTRLWNVDLLSVVKEYAVDFQPPQKGFNGGTGLYAGEEDLFIFLIDPLGWTDIGGQNFCPGFFLWNSEVGKRALGMTCFWLQEVCSNHICWGATEVEEFSRKHTRSVGNGLDDIRRIIDGFTARRDQRIDGFAKAITSAMKTKLGDDAEKVLKILQNNTIPRNLAKRALEACTESGERFTIFAIVDQLTRFAQEAEYAGERVEIDTKASKLLELAI